MNQFLKDNWLKTTIVLLFISLVLPFGFIGASNYKGFLVEEIFDYDKLLITDGYSQYVVELGFGCSTYSIYSGSTIFIDTYFSPSFYDDVIIETIFGTDTCTIQDSDEVNLKEYWVDSVIDSKDEIIVEDKYGDRYLVEHGIGCLSMWRYEEKYIDIDIGGTFLDGIGDRIYLFDSNDDCKVWDVDELSGGSSGTSTYTPPVDLNKFCPANSSSVGGSCKCNNGYMVDSTGKACITYTQGCQYQYGIHSYGDENYCYCSSGYEWNASKTLCIEKRTSSSTNTNNTANTIGTNCPTNSFNSDGECKCNFGYIFQNGACVNHTEICKGQFGEDSYGDGADCYCNISSHWNSSKTACLKNVSCPDNSTELDGQCYCNSGYQWDSSQTICNKIVVVPTVTPVAEEKKEIKQQEQNKEDAGIKTTGQKENKSYPDIKTEENNNQKNTGFLASISDGIKSIFNSFGNFFRNIFK